MTVRFPNLEANDIIVPGSTKLTFDIILNSTDDPNRTLVNNIGRAIVKKKVVKIEGNEILSIDDSDTLDTYYDLWKSYNERRNAIFQGIVETRERDKQKMQLSIELMQKTKPMILKMKQ